MIGKFVEQATLDKKRKTYKINFPTDLDPERVTAWIRTLSGTLRTRQLGHFLAQPAIVLEVWATGEGIEHYLKVPYQYVEMVRPRLESLVPGIRLTLVKDIPTRVWVEAAEYGLTASNRQLSIPNPTDLSHNILTNFSSVKEAETLVLQWVIGPAVPEHKPEVGSSSTSMSFREFIFGSSGEASRDEVNDRRAKLDEPNMQAVLRVGASAPTPIRAQYMVRSLMSSLDSARGPATRFVKRMVTKNELQRRLEGATTPFMFPVKLSAPEMTAVIGWKLGNVMVPGMPSAVSRHIPAPPSVPRQGIVLGQSNYAGQERPIAVGFKEALVHQHVLAPPGKGKSVLLANEFHQIVKAGYGAIVIEQDGNLFKMALDYIPEDRINDVIVLDVSDTKYPVGLNFLKMGHLAADGIDGIFRELYRDHPSMWANLAMYHGLKTLAEAKDGTLIDLLALLSPTSDEVDWSHDLRKRVRDPQLKRYWQEVENEKMDKVQMKLEPIHNRYWPIMRSQLVNILGQSKSSFTMEEVVQQNKILLVNLAGVEEQAAQLMGALIVNALWQAVKANPMPNSPNYLIMDEAHNYMNLPIDLGSMLVEARKFGLGLFFAHQGLYQLPSAMRQAIQQNMQTKIVFQTMADDARDMARVIGRPISEEDITNLPQFGAIARVATPEGMSAPLTMDTLDLSKGYGNAERIIYASRGRYGRSADQVMDEIMARRTIPATGPKIPTTRKPTPDPFGDSFPL